MTEATGNSTASPGGNNFSTSAPAAHRYVKRRNYFVKKWMQSRYILYYLVIMTLSGFALLALMERYARRALYVEMRQGHSAVFDTWTVLEPHIIRANALVVLVVISVAAVTTLVLTWTVHRASGLLASNVRAYTQGSAAEKWAVISHPAEFQHLQGVLAKSLSDYRNLTEGIQQEVAGLEESARGIRERIEGGALPRERVGELRASVQRVKRLFSKRGGEG